jgi:hypothetical protein
MEPVTAGHVCKVCSLRYSGLIGQEADLDRIHGLLRHSRGESWDDGALKMGGM